MSAIQSLSGGKRTLSKPYSTSSCYGYAPKIKHAFDKYDNLTEDTALRVIRFVKFCKAVSKADLQRML
jgi:hypothetical protein